MSSEIPAESFQSGCECSARWGMNILSGKARVSLPKYDLQGKAAGQKLSSFPSSCKCSSRKNIRRENAYHEICDCEKNSEQYLRQISPPVNRPGKSPTGRTSPEELIAIRECAQRRHNEY